MISTQNFGLKFFIKFFLNLVFWIIFWGVGKKISLFSFIKANMVL